MSLALQLFAATSTAGDAPAAGQLVMSSLLYNGGREDLTTPSAITPGPSTNVWLIFAA